MTREQERLRLIRRLKAIKAECEQIFTDVASFNQNNPAAR